VEDCLGGRFGLSGLDIAAVSIVLGRRLANHPRPDIIGDPDTNRHTGQDCLYTLIDQDIMPRIEPEHKRAYIIKEVCIALDNAYDAKQSELFR
jgi:hypothetical protein